jgi:hypothetical protein
MLGIVLTVVAVTLAICFAFYHSDHPSGPGSKGDPLFYVTPKNPRKNSKSSDIHKN